MEAMRVEEVRGRGICGIKTSLLASWTRTMEPPDGARRLQDAGHSCALVGSLLPEPRRLAGALEKPRSWVQGRC